MAGWRRTTAFGATGGLAAGLADALHVVGAGRLDLGAPGVAALAVSGAVVGGAVALLACAVLGLLPAVRRGGAVLALLLGGLTVAAVRVGLGEPPFLLPGLDAGGAAAVAGGAVAVLGLVAVGLAGRVRFGRPALLALAAAGGVRHGAAGLAERPEGAPAGLDRPNLLLITLAGARDDRFGDHPVHTPAFDRLAEEGTRLALAVASGAPVSRAADELLFARSPGDAPDPGERSLAAALGARGWVTGAFLPASLDAAALADFHVVDDDTGWPLGFGRALPGLLFARLGWWRPAPERRAADVVDRAARFLRARSGATFAWVHLQDPLPPYVPPVPYDERYAPDHVGTGGVPLGPRLHPAHGDAFEDVSDPRVLEGRYHGEVAYTDAQIGRLLDVLDQTGRAATTLVVVVGLEGTVLAEGDVWFGRGAELGEGVLRVPAVLRLPGRVPAGEVLRWPVEVADVGATIRDYLAVDDALDGPISLRAAIEGRGGARRFARARADGVAALRFPGALLLWSEARGYRAERPPGEGTEGLAWTADRVREELARMPGASRPPSDAEVEEVRATLQRQSAAAFEPALPP